MKKKRFVNLLLFFFTSFLLGCSGSVEQQLIRTIERYYSLEILGQWAKTYEMRPAEFRKIMEKDYYVQQMNLNNEGWNLLKWEIENIKTTENSAVATIKFFEKVPAHFADEIGLNVKTMRIREETVWIKEGGAWFCKDCGSRTHLPLNGHY